MANTITTYNNIMNDICREYLTIGTCHSEGTDGWNVRDMVSEMQYTLDIYLDPECIYWQDAHDETQPPHKPWLRNYQNEIARMRRFIAKYKDEAMTMECTAAHSSIYD